MRLLGLLRRLYAAIRRGVSRVRCMLDSRGFLMFVTAAILLGALAVIALALVFTMSPYRNCVRAEQQEHGADRLAAETTCDGTGASHY